jgi:hypothetical protein
LNRAVLAATLMLVLPLAQLTPAEAQAPAPGPTPVPNGTPLPGVLASPTPKPYVSPTPTPNLEEEGPRDKQQRIDVFQDRRMIYEINEGTKAYSLRQGPDPIYDVDFVELMKDPSLTKYWQSERNKDWATWIGIGVIGVPIGSLLFLQNFQASGPLALFADPQRTQSQNASDPRSFTLSLAGVVIGMYGFYNLALWVLENVDQYHPNRLDEEALLPRVHTFNDELRDRLNLEPSDIPSPPTPRPSTTATPSQSPSPGTLPLATPGGPVDQSMPEGQPPKGVPTPLPVLEPGSIPSALLPTTRPRPSEFMFPGPPGRVPGSPAATAPPTASAKPSAKPTPRPSVSPVPYPGTEP